jgi:hypothetical protein
MWLFKKKEEPQSEERARRREPRLAIPARHPHAQAAARLDVMHKLMGNGAR